VDALCTSHVCIAEYAATLLRAPADVLRMGKVLRREAGFTLPEAVMALAVLAIGILMTITPVAAALSGLHRAKLVAIASNLAQARVEEIRSLSYFDVGFPSSSPAGVLTDTETVTAIKYRFIHDEPGGLRYIARRGSAPILFGLWSLVPRHHTLLLVEGELNALSVWQCLPDGVSCLSFGSESGWRPDVLRDVARGVRRILVWADDPARASQMRLALGGQVQALRSSSTNGRKWDANMLLQHGRLMQFLETLLGVPCLGRVDTASPISRPRLAASAKGRGTDHNQRKRAASR